MTQEQAKGLLQLQTALTQMTAQFGAFRGIMQTAIASKEASFIKDDLLRLDNVMELMLSETKAIGESFTQKLIEAIASDE